MIGFVINIANAYKYYCSFVRYFTELNDPRKSKLGNYRYTAYFKKTPQVIDL